MTRRRRVVIPPAFPRSIVLRRPAASASRDADRHSIGSSPSTVVRNISRGESAS